MNRAAPRAWLLAALLASGCATTPYPFAEHGETELTLALRAGEPQIERGEPNAWIDGLGHYFFSLPTKLILFRWSVDNHDIPPKVEQSLSDYLRVNGLCNVKVRLNQYAPGDEYRRLFKNKEMPAAWRYSLGLISVTTYTIFPERLLAGFPFIGGGDHYNPYTNTISIYSGSRPIVLHEGGHVKDLASIENRHWKGLYTGFRSFPFLGITLALWQEAEATNDALSWELATGSSRESKSAYRTLYPAYGTYVGSAADSAATWFVDWWVSYAIQYGAVVAGHAVGQTRALLVSDRAEGIEPEVLSGPPAAVEETALAESAVRRASCPPLVPAAPDPAPAGG